MWKSVTGCVLFLAASLQAQSLPGSFDLRTILDGSSSVSWVPAIQDQGYFNDCWTFASATAMNSNLLMNGYLATSSVAPDIQISSWHLSTSNGAPESIVGPNYGGDGNHSWGGFEYQALGYVTRGQGIWQIPGVNPNSTTILTTMGGGPVLNSQSPTNPFPTVFENSAPTVITQYLPPASQTPAYQVRSVTMYDQGFSNNVALPTPTTPGGSNYVFNQGAADAQVISVKNAITAKGAVTTSMNATDYSYFSYVQNGSSDIYTVNYVNPSTNPNNTDHEVTIIGWDDSYQIADSTGAITSGAWIVQNSWGTSDWGNSTHKNDGTFYVSYNDAAIGRTGVASFELGSAEAYSPTVLQNELGPMSYANNYVAGQGPLGMAQRNELTAASRLTSDTNTQLLALGLASQVADVSVTVSIYGSWGDGSLSDLLGTQTFTLDGIGYQLNDLAAPIDLLAGEEIVIKLDYSIAGAMPVVIGGTGLNGYETVDHDLSYYWDANTSTWKDFADVSFEAYQGYNDITGGILFVKGLTAIPEPSTYTLLALAGLALLIHARRRQGNPLLS